ncbi:MAG: hypothetical protein DHS20C01_37820 [marine bacterium B5-7]|nr:MAG: hypothetical protein DHS20C01_37820 [marine bacterium B5-7]
MNEEKPHPDKRLLFLVRARFIERGESLHGWCNQHGINHAYAHRALTGVLRFPAARRLRLRILSEVGLTQDTSIGETLND